MTIDTTNPETGEILERYESLDEGQLAELLDANHKAYLSWRHTSFQERSDKLSQLAIVLEKEKDNCATIMAKEMGKPIAQGRLEIDKCIKLCHYYAENAESQLADKAIQTESSKSYVCYRPLGTVFAIMPWNFPFWQVLRFLCPTLMAGNAGLLKHAPICTGTALKIEEMVREAGFPQDLYRSLVMVDSMSEQVIKHHSVIAVTLTGSERAGSAVSQIAGKHLKKIVLELGGSDPYVICDDADLDLAAEQVIQSRLNNTGQVCIAAKRIIASKQIMGDFRDKIIALVQNYEMGSPLDENCNFGPMARLDLRDELHQQVQKSIQGGATLIQGGEVPDRTGFYYPATIIENVNPGNEAFDHELFGPVVSMTTADSEDHALTLANQTPYGLGAAVFTQDIDKGERIARDVLEAGACFVNKFVGSDPRLPFGGIKLSGHGRELSQEGILEFVNAKTVVVR